MSRRRRGERVLGPYEHHRKWRVILVNEGGDPIRRDFETEKDAKQYARNLRKVIEGEAAVSIDEAMENYEMHLRHVKQNKQGSIDTTLHRLRSIFVERGELVRDLTREGCIHLYEELRKKQMRSRKTKTAVDTHRNTLAEAKTFLRWCVKKRYCASNPMQDIEGVGRRKKGKEQLRITESRNWLDIALELADQGEPGAVAAMITLLMGLRSIEIRSRVVRDLDDEGRLLWIPCSKTPAGKRTVEVPAVLQPYLAELCKGKKSDDRIFPYSSAWPRNWVKRICRKAGVMVVTAHGMRGTHSSLAEEHGTTAHVVAKALGHESPTTTHAHYSKPSSVDNGRQRRVLAVLKGGVR